MPDPTIQNLTTLANAGEGKAAGTRIGHESLKFQFVAGTDSTFKFDNWTNIKTTSTTPSKVEMQGAVAWAAQLACQTANFNWADSNKCKSSFFDYLARDLFFATTLPDDWAHPATTNTADWITLPLRAGVVLTNAPEQLLFKFLVSGAAIAYWREASGIKLNISNVNLHVVKPASSAKSAGSLVVPGDFTVTHLEFDWAKLLQNMRYAVRNWAKTGVNAPASPRDADSRLNGEIFELMKDISGFKTLIKAEYITTPDGMAEEGYRFKNTAKLFCGDSAANDKHSDFKIAFNHARFIMWMEWRMATEMCGRVNGGIY